MVRRELVLAVSSVLGSSGHLSVSNKINGQKVINYGSECQTNRHTYLSEPTINNDTSSHTVHYHIGWQPHLKPGPVFTRTHAHAHTHVHTLHGHGKVDFNTCTHAGNDLLLHALWVGSRCTRCVLGTWLTTCEPAVVTQIRKTHQAAGDTTWEE